MCGRCERPERSQRYRCRYRRRQRDLRGLRCLVGGGVFPPARFHSSRSGSFLVFSYRVPRLIQNHQRRLGFLDHWSEGPPYPLPLFCVDLRTVRPELPRKGPDMDSQSVLRSISDAHRDSEFPTPVCVLAPSLGISGCCARWCIRQRRR